MPIQMRTAQHSADSPRMTNIAWPGGNLSTAPDCLRASCRAPMSSCACGF